MPAKPHKAKTVVDISLLRAAFEAESARAETAQRLLAERDNDVAGLRNHVERLEAKLRVADFNQGRYLQTIRSLSGLLGELQAYKTDRQVRDAYEHRPDQAMPAGERA